MRVIAKAYGDRPLDRVAVGWSGKAVIIAAQSVADAMQEGEVGGVGFPTDCVFQFDAVLFESLQRAWESGDRGELGRQWSRAVRAHGETRKAA
jgi:hypothetical protein